MTRSLLFTRQTAVWAGLVLMTLLSWWAGHGIGSARAAGIAVLTIAFAKVALVIREFMEVRHAPRWLQLITMSWAAGASMLLAALFVVAT